MADFVKRRKTWPTTLVVGEKEMIYKNQEKLMFLSMNDDVSFLVFLFAFFLVCVFKAVKNPLDLKINNAALNTVQHLLLSHPYVLLKIQLRTTFHCYASFRMSYAWFSYLFFKTAVFISDTEVINPWKLCWVMVARASL